MLLQKFFSNANWLAITVATLSYFVLGALWYSKILFAKPWMAGHGIGEPTPEAKKKMPMMMVMCLLMNFIVTLAIGMLVMGLGSIMCMSGIKLGLLCAVLGIVPMVMSHMFTGRPVKVWVIDAAYHAVAYVLVAIILSVWH
jgi:hypothetical protein